GSEKFHRREQFHSETNLAGSARQRRFARARKKRKRVLAAPAHRITEVPSDFASTRRSPRARRDSSPRQPSRTFRRRSSESNESRVVTTSVRRGLARAQRARRTS